MTNFTTAQRVIITGGGGAIPTTIPIPSFYVSKAGSDSNNGTSQSAPWRTPAKVAATVFPAPSYILFRTGDEWDIADLPASGSGIVVPQAGLIFGSYGGGAAPIFNALTDIKGSAADWVEYATNGTTPQPGSHRWGRTIAGNTAKRLLLVIDSLMPVDATGMPTWSQTTASKVDATGEWRWQYNTSPNTYTVWVYSLTNPGSNGSTYQVTSAGFAVDAFDLQVTIRDPMTFFGFNYGVTVGGGSIVNPTAITGVLSQFHCAKAFWITNGGVGGHTSCTGFDAGYSSDGASGKGDEIFDFTGGAIDRFGVLSPTPPLLTVAWTLVDCKADNAKEDELTMRYTSDTSLIAVSATNPAGYSSYFTTPPKSENCWDIKSGNLSLTGIFGHSQALGPLTVQIDAKVATVSNSLISVNGGNHPAVSLAETQTSLVSDHSGYYSEGSSCILWRYTGKQSSMAFDVADASFSSSTTVLAAQQGKLSLLYTTAIASQLQGTSRALYFQDVNNAANVSAIEFVSGPSGGFNTLRFVCTGVFQNFFGDGSVWNLVLPTFPALNGPVTITTCYPHSVNTAPHYANFLVADSIVLPATFDITGMSLTAVPFCTLTAAPALIGTLNTLYGPVVASLSQASYNAALVASTSLTDAPVRRSNRNYTVAQSISNVAANQNLKNDTGGRWGGISNLDATQWQVVLNQDQENKTAVSSLTIGANGTVTVVTTAPHGWSTGRKVRIRGATPTYVNSWWWITVTGASSFTFPRPRYPRLSVDVVATGTIIAWDGSLLAGSAGLGTAATIDATPYTTDFQGAALPVSGRNMGAVQA